MSPAGGPNEEQRRAAAPFDVETLLAEAGRRVATRGRRPDGAAQADRLGKDGESAALPADLLAKWQTIVDTMAELVDVPAGLIMRLDGDVITVCVSSRSPGNPYHVGEGEAWEGSGLYCETVIKSRQVLLVPDALVDAGWCRNPDVPRGMTSYLGFPIRWPDGRPFGTICVLDSKPNGYHERYARLIEHFRDLIEHHLGLVFKDHDRQRELQEAQAELAHVSRLAEINHLAGALVHEINQPLAAVANFAAACLRWLERDDPDVPTACATLRQLVGASRRVANVIDGLRSLAHKAPVAATVFDLRGLVLETMAMLRDRLDRDSVADDVCIDPTAQYVIGDRIQVQLVLHNLVRNAIDAMAGVHDRTRRLTVSAEEFEPGRLTIRVDDNGTGLEPSIAARILRGPFTTKATGMGVGLTICQSVIEAHGGTITASPNPHGPGAQFAFTLPAGRPNTTEAGGRRDGRAVG